MIEPAMKDDKDNTIEVRREVSQQRSDSGQPSAA
jgi:hypothetical protein